VSKVAFERSHSNPSSVGSANASAKKRQMKLRAIAKAAESVSSEMAAELQWSGAASVAVIWLVVLWNSAR
jgi:hypothetical protein